MFFFCSYKFKAREFDHKLVELNGMCGVDPMKHLPVTETKPFSFQSDVRLEHRKKHEEEKKEKGEIAKKEHHHEKASEKVSHLNLWDTALVNSIVGYYIWEFWDTLLVNFDWT